MVPSATNFEDYPPEFNLSLQDLQRFGIPEIWAAYHEQELRPKVFRKWRASGSAFPAWVAQEIYAQRRAKYGHSYYYEEWDKPEPVARPSWHDLYSAELAESPGLEFGLTSGLGEVFKRAKLSPSEAAVMRRLAQGIDPSDFAEELQMSLSNIGVLRRRAVIKLKEAFCITKLL